MLNKLKFILLLPFVFYLQAHAQQTKALPADMLKKMFEVVKKDPSGPLTDTFVKQLELLVNSDKEEDLSLAEGYYFQLKRNKTSDSVYKVMKQRFPLGYTNRGDEVELVYNATDALKMENNFKAWIAKFPPEKFSTGAIIYDYARSGLARKFIREKQVEKGLFYLNQLEQEFWRGEGFAGTSYDLLAIGDTANALMLLKRAIDNAKPFLNPKPDDNKAQFAAAGYPSYNLMYAELLSTYKKDDALALKYLEESTRYAKNINPAYYMIHANALRKLGRHRESLLKLEESIIEGISGKKTEEALKQAYLSVYKDDSGFSSYQEGLQQKMIARIEAKVSKQSIDEPAAAFALKDLNGKLVSLADMKGKVVVLDFWATWCGPCVRSFPAMQTALNKYKNDPKVQFLFIDTWEKVPDYEKLVKELMKSKGYTFDVLFDPKDPVSNTNVAESYKVTGIPAKFVIDGNGRIRFKLTGFSGGEAAAVQELSSMIELAKKEGKILN